MERKRVLITSLSGILIGLIIIATFLYGLYIGKGEENKKSVFLEETRLEGTKVIHTNIVAVDNEGKGVTAKLITEIRPGSGLILVNINDVLADINTQYSARIAAKVAKEYTKKDLSNIDVLFNIDADAGVVGGQSAGSTMAIAVIAALEDKELNPDIMMTGSIEPDGRLGNAGKIKEKALAAKKQGAKKFLIPPASAEETALYKREKNCYMYQDGEYCEIKYEQDATELGEALGIEIIPVKTIGDAAAYYFNNDQTTV